MAFRTCNTRPRRGTSLAEALLASAVLAVAVVGVAGPLIAAHEQSQTADEQNVAMILARQLMEEIAAKPLCDAGGVCSRGPESGIGESGRSKFDSADDYHGYSDNTQDMTLLSGMAVSLHSERPYSRSVSMEYRATPAGAAAASGDFGLVTVSVTTPGNQVIKLSRLLSRQTLSN